jgi:ATP-dependent Clp protease adapter protein ClpS
MTRLSSLAVLFCFFHLAQAFHHARVFSPRPAFVDGHLQKRDRYVAASPATLLLGQAQPEIQIKTKVKVETVQKQKVEIKQKAKTGEPVERRDDDFQDAPMYKLMLLADDGYDVEHVVNRMCAIVDDLDEDAAATVFKQAQKAGKAMCGKYPFERAELFKEQLIRSEPMIFSDLEEENA